MQELEKSPDLLERARSGDQTAFQQLIEPYKGELQLHCYRILGSTLDAEDALQETLLSAWQALGKFEGRSAISTWLYQIATNRVLSIRRSARRRSRAEDDMGAMELPEPTRIGEI